MSFLIPQGVRLAIGEAALAGGSASLEATITSVLVPVIGAAAGATIGSIIGQTLKLATPSGPAFGIPDPFEALAKWSAKIVQTDPKNIVIQTGGGYVKPTLVGVGLVPTGTSDTTITKPVSAAAVSSDEAQSDIDLFNYYWDKQWTGGTGVDVGLPTGSTTSTSNTGSTTGTTITPSTGQPGQNGGTVSQTVPVIQPALNQDGIPYGTSYTVSRTPSYIESTFNTSPDLIRIDPATGWIIQIISNKGTALYMYAKPIPFFLRTDPTSQYYNKTGTIPTWLDTGGSLGIFNGVWSNIQGIEFTPLTFNDVGAARFIFSAYPATWIWARQRGLVPGSVIDQVLALPKLTNVPAQPLGSVVGDTPVIPTNVPPTVQPINPVLVPTTPDSTVTPTAPSGTNTQTVPIPEPEPPVTAPISTPPPNTQQPPPTGTTPQPQPEPPTTIPTGEPPGEVTIPDIPGPYVPPTIPPTIPPVQGNGDTECQPGFHKENGVCVPDTPGSVETGGGIGAGLGQIPWWLLLLLLAASGDDDKKKRAHDIAMARMRTR